MSAGNWRGAQVNAIDSTDKQRQSDRLASSSAEAIGLALSWGVAFTLTRQ
jgi:hypothetical protein